MKLVDIIKKENVFIHTKTKNQANRLMKELDKQELEWADGRKYNHHNNHWKLYKANTCYCPHDGYIRNFGSLDADGFTIVEFKDVDFEIEGSIKLNNEKIDILGTTYTLLEDTSINNPKLIKNRAYFEPYSKKIVYELPNIQEVENVEKIDEFNQKIIRHEIIHTFFYESGLKDYGNDEVLVDWIASQFPKIVKVFQKLKIE